MWPIKTKALLMLVTKIALFVVFSLHTGKMRKFLGRLTIWWILKAEKVLIEL